MENPNSNHVIITDIKIPFWSMVVLMVKAAIASIPAILIVSFIFTALSVIFGGFFSGISHF